MELLNINRHKKGMILFYVLMMSIMWIMYLFMNIIGNTYEIQIYERAYLYLMIFSFLLYTGILLVWEYEKDFIKNCVEIVIFTFSIIPILLTIFMSGKIPIQNIFLPLFMEIFWGIGLISTKKKISQMKIPSVWKNFIVMIFIFMFIIVSSILLYCYYEYASLVLTTVYDKDIPIYFFLNPVLSFIGTLYMQVGGGNQMGAKPIYIYFIFWALWTFVMNISNSQECSQ
ncbi:hypothetical protein [Anaerophilus nitritogenes]|uniref:hypothetical protein n=1 Tax=Anaerophilus nitritogenes TaxID=2498136 RepID=UPI00101D0321|nr:hypothetical protein [Anaerophilus nitritogenes]